MFWVSLLTANQQNFPGVFVSLVLIVKMQEIRLVADCHTVAMAQEMSVGV
jgi:hypothetical protein